jgi:hypothetical protein
MVTITTLPPSTGAIMPDAKQLRSLRRIVAAAHPWIDGIAVDSEEADREFWRAFWAVRRFYRTELPDETRGFGALLDDANLSLRESIGGAMFLAACLASGDVVWRRGDTSVGQLLTVGLNPFRGLKANNRWLAILSGTGNILSPMPPRQEFVQRAARGVPQATFWEKGTNSLRQIDARDPLWRR